MASELNQGRIFELVELECSGSELLIYSVIMDDQNRSLYDHFLAENKDVFLHEVDDLTEKLKVIGAKTGLKRKWYKRDEGKFGDGVCALFDEPDRNLRLYFVLFGNVYRDLAIVIGGGGPKDEKIKALQEDEKLKAENFLVRDIAEVLNRKWLSKELRIDSDGFYIDDDEDDDIELIFKI